jgi:hypothetical protein
VLAEGSLLTAETLTADRRQLIAQSDLFGAVKFPLEALAGVVFHRPSNPAAADKLLDRIVHAAEQQNSPLPLGEGQGVRTVLLLDNGDELSGTFSSIADGTAKLDTDVGPIEVKADRAAALIFNAARKPTPRAGQLQAWAGMSDGSRLLATQLLMVGKSLKLTTAGQSLATSPEALVFLQPLGGRARYLSDLKPSEYHQTPFLDLAWPYQVDRNVTGGQLRCHGRLYLKGLGVHSAARLVYRISPLPLGVGQNKEPSPLPLGEGQGVRAARFEADVGIDDSTAGSGSVVFRVLVDGQEKFASNILRGGDRPVHVAVDVAGAKKLELLVDYADHADVMDHADWLDARLIVQ